MELSRSRALTPALASAATFGTSGVLAASLLASGWSPGAAVAVRASGAALVLTAPALLQLRGRWASVLRARWRLLCFGALAVAGCQLGYFCAVRSLPVPLALLVEYSGVLLVVGWTWAVHGRRPGLLTSVGALAAIGGLTLVLGVGGLGGLGHMTESASDGSGATGSSAVVGLVWAGLAALCLAVYFVLGARAVEEVPALATSWIGLLVGAAVLTSAGAVGALPMTVSATDTDLAGHLVPWWLSMLTLVVVATAFAYATGVTAARRLGAAAASFLSLTEVLFAAVWAWLALGQELSAVQVAGGMVVLAGVVLVQVGTSRDR